MTRGTDINKRYQLTTDATTVVTTTRLNLSYNNNNDDGDKVKVNIVSDIDPLTVTALGFGLIAMNFLVFANMGDAGIGGVIARVINYFRY